MNTREKNKYEMLEAVFGFYDANKSLLTNLPAAVSAFSEINALIKEIALNEKIIQEGTKSKIASRDDSQSELIKMALIISGAIYGYAADKNDTELMVFADLNTRSFNKLRNSEIPIVVEKLLDKADSLGNELINYGITEVKRTAAREKLIDYSAKYGSVTSGKVSKKTANATIKILFEKADKKLKMLDKILLVLKDTNLDAYTKYEAARVIWDKASSHRIEEAEPVA